MSDTLVKAEEDEGMRLEALANEIAFLRRRRDAREASGATAGVKTLVERTRPGGTGG